jgi:hypothetical protein
MIDVQPSLSQSVEASSSRTLQSLYLPSPNPTPQHPVKFHVPPFNRSTKPAFPSHLPSLICPPYSPCAMPYQYHEKVQQTERDPETYHESIIIAKHSSADCFIMLIASCVSSIQHADRPCRIALAAVVLRVADMFPLGM